MTFSNPNEQQQQQQQFPPPPPYSRNSTTLVDVVKQQQQQPCSSIIHRKRTTTTTTSMDRELRKALQDFRVYKRSLGDTLFFAAYYVVYLLLMLALYQQREVLIVVVILEIVMLFAIAGVINKRSGWLHPMFIIFVSLYLFYLFICVVSTCWLLTGHPKHWTALVLEDGTTRGLMHYFGLSAYQTVFLTSILTFICCLVTCFIAVEILTAMMSMSKYCPELHRMALNMIGTRTNLSDPALIKHMRKHIDRKAMRSSRA